MLISFRFVIFSAFEGFASFVGVGQCVQGFTKLRRTAGDKAEVRSVLPLLIATSQTNTGRGAADLKLVTNNVSAIQMQVRTYIKRS